MRKAGPRLAAFASEAELRAFLRGQTRVMRRQFEDLQNFSAPTSGSLAARSADMVTNVQHAGVDEGDIVKAHGEHLIVLRRGRLFTLRIGVDRLTPVSTVDAFAPGIDPRHTWYDEILVADGTVVVIGYSYERGGTEIGLFDLDAQGRLAYRATYHLRTNDYYSSRNYASRLLGSTLVFYTPLQLGWREDPGEAMPALRKWHPGATASEFVPIYSVQRLFRPPAGAPADTLHTVVTCDLAQRELSCTATGVMGPSGRVFYVSPAAVYVWTAGDRWKADASPAAWLYRLAWQDAEPGVVRVEGSPFDQFSFLEDDTHLNVLVRAGGGGDGMWRSEGHGPVSLLRLPLSTFSLGAVVAASGDYTPLPPVTAGQRAEPLRRRLPALRLRPRLVARAGPGTATAARRL